MNTETGEIKELTTEEVEAIQERLGREARPGDKVTARPGDPRVVISAEAARKLAFEQNERHREERALRPRRERKVTKHEKGRGGRKRREARHRANGV